MFSFELAKVGVFIIDLMFGAAEKYQFFLLQMNQLLDLELFLSLKIMSFQTIDL